MELRARTCRDFNISFESTTQNKQHYELKFPTQMEEKSYGI